jgi:hypothetical protein
VRAAPWTIVLPRLNAADAERFRSFVPLGVTEYECWEWRGGINARGYPIFSVNNKSYRAHRIALAAKIGGDIPAGLFACHSCDNPSCVNPDHLFAGTAQENARDAISKKRQWGPAPWPACKRGHALVPPNKAVTIRPDGTRHSFCRECSRITARLNVPKRRELRREQRLTQRSVEACPRGACPRDGGGA